MMGRFDLLAEAGSRGIDGNYDPSNEYLHARVGQEAALGFKDIETVNGAQLPSSAGRYREWWSNEVMGSPVPGAILDGGWFAG